MLATLLEATSLRGGRLRIGRGQAERVSVRELVWFGVGAGARACGCTAYLCLQHVALLLEHLLLLLGDGWLLGWLGLKVCEAVRDAPMHRSLAHVRITLSKLAFVLEVDGWFMSAEL